ncbi:MAG TPA: hypothetical protein PKE13_10245 [Hyphomicrobium zavarzinii]|nr:hypothetical protein [Hyphomicrobium zavarzinii]
MLSERQVCASVELKDAGLKAELQAAFAGRHGQRPAAARMNVRADVVDVRRLITIRVRAGLGVAVVSMKILTTQVMAMMLHGQRVVSAYGESRFAHQIAVKAAGENGHSNHDNSQELARHTAHNLRKAGRFEIGQAQTWHVFVAYGLA